MDRDTIQQAVDAVTAGIKSGKSDRDAQAALEDLSTMVLHDVHRIADALENLVAIQFAACPTTVKLPHD